MVKIKLSFRLAEKTLIFDDSINYALKSSNPEYSHICTYLNVTPPSLYSFILTKNNEPIAKVEKHFRLLYVYDADFVC